ncbi:GNAT family N-acetyltransferase [Streptomyces bambusae]|uniref:GNAT family N-acetyltransferase n=1 Tax=Streptomyces bambusae TaxID=1550616 RepID=A0ABS6YZZ6_9ACTN|nr:GNAT family N-acetyltransferase [Streptomyces bambusae]MBW5481037.1 GNAT family N-acetyltransferase [Streptomyces bambusae]
MTALRALALADALAVRRIYSGASVTYLMRPEMTEPEAEQYVIRIQEWAAADPIVQYVLGVDVGGDLVGVVKLDRRPNAHGRVSYVFREDTWGRGYATGAVQQLITFAFTTAAFESLGAKHHPDNPASGRVLTKAGFTRLRADDGFVHYQLEHAYPAAEGNVP